MLVFPDGSQAGTLGGGCVEAEVKRRRPARPRPAAAAEIAHLQLDDDYGWDDGLICGGRMKMLVDPLGDRRRRRRTIAALARAGRARARAAPRRSSSTPSRPAARGRPLSVRRRRASCVAQLAAAAADRPTVVSSTCRRSPSGRGPYAAQGVAYLPRLPRCRLLIVGGGHVGQAVARAGRRGRFRRLGGRRPRATTSAASASPRAERLHRRRHRRRCCRSSEIDADTLLPDRHPRPQPRRGGAVSPGRHAAPATSA